MDTRTDVYSMSVLTAPDWHVALARQPLLASGFEEMSAPDSAKSSLSGRASTLLAAARRRQHGLVGTQPPRLAKQLRGDLDWGSTNEGARAESLPTVRGRRRNSRLTFDAISAMNLVRPVHRVGCIEQGNSSCATGLG